MNPLPNLNFWLQSLGLLALQTAVVVSLAAGVQIWLKSAAARRAAWQGALLGVALLTVNAFTGADRALASWAKLEPAARRIAVARGNLPSTLDTSHAGVLPVSRPLPVAGSEVSVQPTAPLWWPAWLWLAGTLVFGGRALGSRLLLAVLVSRADTALLPGRRRGNESSVLAEKQSPSMSPERRTPVRRVGIELEQRVRAELEFGAPTTRPRRPVNGRGILLTSAPTSDGPAGTVVDPELQERVASLAERLGLRRPVRLMESASLISPIAFGWWRPTIGLPQGFFTDHSRAEQDTMLAHELAHLAARDPLWLALADALSAALWWHPAVWWVRRQFRVASETAADDASLLVQDGPVILADCLVSLAAQLPTRRATGWLGMAEFRSGLGRRVERLLRLRPEEGGALGQKARWVAPALVAFVLLGLAAAAWAFPNSRSEGPTLFALVREAIGPEPLQESDLPRRYIVQLPGTTVYNSLTGFSTSAPAEEVAAEAPPGTTPNSVGIAPAMPESPTAIGGSALLFARTYQLESPWPLVRAEDSNANAVPASIAKPPGSTNSLCDYLAAAGWKPRPGETIFLSGRGTRLFVRATRTNLDLVEAALAKHLAKPNRVLHAAAEASTNRSDASGQFGPVKVTGAAPDHSATNSPAGSQFRSRTFKVDVPTLMENIAAVTGKPVTDASSALAELRRLFPLAGWDPGAGEAIFLNERTGVLFVRAAETNLVLIEAIVEALNSRPLQVLVQVKVVEVTLGVGQPLDYAVARADINPSVSAGHEVSGDELDWAGRAVTNAHNVRVNAMLDTMMTGILTDPQYHVVMKTLEQRPGTDVIAAPSVTTLSGRQAQISVQETKTVVTGTDPVAGTNAVTTAVIPCGPVMDVVPTVLADGVTVQVNVKASVTEFLGYEPATPGSGSGTQPRFRLRELKTIANVWDGQTLVLGGPIVEATRSTTNRAGAVTALRKQLLVLVTPTIVDAAGNRVHTAEEMPFSNDAVPPQPKPGK